MTVTAEVIGAQLVAHDEQDVADRAHRLRREACVPRANGVPRCDCIRTRDCTEAQATERIPRYSLKPERLMIGPQRAVSAAMIAASASGVVPVGS
jgi:hypothetical protein